LFRPRSAVLAAVATAILLAPSAAQAAAEVHRFNVVLSGIPTSVKADDFNDLIDFFNNAALAPGGFEPLAKINFAWLFDGEVRYFATQNLALSAGVGQLRAKSVKEYLPALSQSFNVRAELISVPVHIGAAYYLQPYNQGDFQARLFFGVGLEHYTHSRTSLESIFYNSSTNTGSSFKFSSTQDSPGYYAEGGAHMFFASRYSVLLSLLYRSGKVEGLVFEGTGLPESNPKTGKPASLDVSGLGLRMAVSIGL
jgi:hypothetical protein